MWVATVVEVVVVEIANVSTEIVVVFVHAIVGIVVVVAFGVDLVNVFRC